MNIHVVTKDNVDELAEKEKFKKNINEAQRKILIKEIESWDTVRDNFKFQFFFSLIVNSHYTKNLLDVINKDYPDNTDTAFKYHKENNLI